MRRTECPEEVEPANSIVVESEVKSHHLVSFRQGMVGRAIKSA